MPRHTLIEISAETLRGPKVKDATAAASVNGAAINTGVHAPFCIIVLFRYMPRSGIAGSNGNF